MELRVQGQRERGTVIGQKVRLLGSVDAVNPHLVSIGDYSVVGRECALLAHCPIKGALPCKVGRYVYLSWGVIVLPGVTIGDHCIIGAGSVVTKDVAPGWVAAGNPARPLRRVTDDERAHIERTMHNDWRFGQEPLGTVPTEE
jgi:acetyltransferase-like isoleucine patch superfamily enzyme